MPLSSAERPLFEASNGRGLRAAINLPTLIVVRAISWAAKEVLMSRDEQILEALSRWAAKHPRPDEPTIVTGSERFSPRQLVSEVRDRTRAGKLMLRVVEHSAEQKGLEEVIAAFDHS